MIVEAPDMLGGNGILLENHVVRDMGDIEAIDTFQGTETTQALIVTSPGSARSPDGGRADHAVRGRAITRLRGSLTIHARLRPRPSPRSIPHPAEPASAGCRSARTAQRAVRARPGGRPGPPYIDARGIGIARSNETIDEAAVAAGRDPREIRRLLNLDVVAASVDWVEQLLPFVIEHGFGTLIHGSDDPRTIQTFGEEVGPALRAAVERAPRRRHADRPVRGAAALAQRRPGIDYDAVPPGVEAIEPGDRAYSRVRSTYLRRGTGARPATADARPGRRGARVRACAGRAARHPPTPLRAARCWPPRSPLVDAVQAVGDADGLVQGRALEPQRQVQRRAAGDPLDGAEPHA